MTVYIVICNGVVLSEVGDTPQKAVNIRDNHAAWSRTPLTAYTISMRQIVREDEVRA